MPKKVAKKIIDENNLLDIYEEIKTIFEHYDLSPLECKLILELILDELNRVIDYVESKELHKLNEDIAVGKYKPLSHVA